ncbi:cytochrome P450 81Q32-like [Pistacia vera]|uniref:cytochrome P450 81Q32-like n=1 Tax=Pistacia vera TaxID=55513 RepID=UPI001263759F|nr:cytochrome P450 81Q32-like [Pistacia vera]XP_031267238.1 cytochrome P450 81Q32-like [Pistacia vera]XP_031267246.1 cytochrome P450 81Q32-like [Pistacia vera]XP_031267247.1 cytochrome P450 81Q32-like [Pistacia vera]
MGSWYLCFPVFLALYVITKHFLNKFQNLPPSPFLSLPIIGHLYLLKKPIHQTLYRISKQHGPIAFLQFGCRKVVVVSSPSAAEECLTKNDIIFAKRPRMTIGKILGYNYTILSWAPYGDHWRNLRKIAALQILSISRLQMFSGIPVDEAKILIRKLLHNQDQSVELRTMFFELTLNVMMRMIAGKRYYGDNIADLEESKRFKEIHRETFKLAGTPCIGDYLPLFKSKKLENMLIKFQRKRDEFMQGLIEEHRRRRRGSGHDSETDRKNTLIEVLLGLQESEPVYYNDEIIKGLMLIMLLAGTDTTVNAIEWALTLLLNHQEVLEKVQKEIDKHVGQERLIEESDLAQLPCLSNIINETMRMYPPSPLLLPHESSEKCVVGGFHIPQGTILFANLWAIQNDPKLWADPTKFKPERFEGVERGRDGFRLMPFGSGRRGCPGEGLGLTMFGLVLGSMIQCFQWMRTGEEMVDMTEGAGLTLSKAQPLHAKCRPRPIMFNLLSQI